ncbi:leucine--tRNA ligase [Porphyromonas endodontalis]|uniref:Leucine--tRNA ligase n=1 Tax=Porphyromonas endodontalis (strain ATCC 35406 / DSM 24491 / JCM 8526 / CCUG 16442 / BCRC 14492 / NCTC 13058 / HG 370) TaxID=553175 RepID=C3J8U3_POREA|nr:leucine--tRNA ligase [Porphyromonas endodontalis]EEN83429.1 leucine--tRNA ligase [Porphyromonas endodontalis ATCC 35406]UBH64815.1 leucine--tRNA ligase [Porphyromonas endodontalis]SUB68606.1 Leucine--tRNA ligase [Porphyromonas endodontalis]
MEYNFSEIEAQVQAFWREHDVYKVTENPNRPPFYVLDMFPYPSGAGLHVGHPLGYIASDIFSRYKRSKGFSVLHPMGYDAFGLPAEQYAIQTGQHPEVTTEINIKRYREQLEKIGFSYDWSREVRTSDPAYYKWTQWVFARLFESYYDTKSNSARPIESLVAHFEEHGSEGIHAYTHTPCSFSREEWLAYTPQEKSDVLMNYRLAYLGESVVNWCAELGTVLANDEVSEGVSIRGGHPVEQRKMKQWCLRVSAYAERLLTSLETLEWTDALKEMQRNWIGRSEGAEVDFEVEGTHTRFTVFTTRPDTIYGVSFMVLAPESDLVREITTPEQKAAVEEYLAATKRKTERERIADRRVTGVFSGAYARNPLTGAVIPIWISDYVLAGYGTGAIMAVPAHDTRDFAFARHFGLPITQVVLPNGEEPSETDSWEDAKASKEGTLINSGILNGLSVADAIKTMNSHIEKEGLGKVKVNYRLRDAIFSRQRYWGEPFPIYYKEGIPTLVADDQLPLKLPEVDAFLPTETGEPPLGRAANWHTPEGYPYELSTMPGFAGSSAYYLRYMDPHNDHALVGEEANRYWRHVDLYIGGTEHATGHLIYSRFWNKFLFDLGVVCEDEPFRKLVNQGMIQGRSNFVYRIKNSNTFVSLGKKDEYDTTEIHVDVNIVHNDKLDLEAFRAWRPEYNTAEFITEEDGSYQCGWAVEKMSKSMYNVVNPDDIIASYGADTLRLYEMFLGPLEQSKPWDTKGIDGVHRFLKKLFGLFYKGEDLAVTDTAPTPEELKSLHKLIRKVGQDIEQFSFNTSVSAFMICVGDLQHLKTSSRAILEPLLVVLSPFAPHITEYLYRALGNSGSIVDAEWPQFEEKYLVESVTKYPVSFNGKVRFTLEIAASATPQEVESAALSAPEAAKWLEGKQPKKVIVVPGRIVNIVL